jgi:hypothetical protein
MPVQPLTPGDPVRSQSLLFATAAACTAEVSLIFRSGSAA